MSQPSSGSDSERSFNLFDAQEWTRGRPPGRLALAAYALIVLILVVLALSLWQVLAGAPLIIASRHVEEVGGPTGKAYVAVVQLSNTSDATACGTVTIKYGQRELQQAVIVNPLAMKTLHWPLPGYSMEKLQVRVESGSCAQRQ